MKGDPFWSGDIAMDVDGMARYPWDGSGYDPITRNVNPDRHARIRQKHFRLCGTNPGEGLRMGPDARPSQGCVRRPRQPVGPVARLRDAGKQRQPRSMRATGAHDDPVARAPQPVTHHPTGRGWWQVTAPHKQNTRNIMNTDIETIIDGREVLTKRIDTNTTRPNLVTSRVHNKATHRLILDIDVPHKYVPSSTDGNGHLYLNVDIEWRQLVGVVDAMVAAGLLDAGWVEAGKAFGALTLRLPNVEKRPGAVDSKGNFLT